MGSFLARVIRSQMATPIWVTRTAVKTEVNTPIDSVQAKPRTGPAPNWNMIRAAPRVVMLASRMVDMARLKPLLRHLTTIDFGRLTYRSELDGIIKAAGMKVLEDVPVPGSIDTKAQTARLLVLSR